MSRFKPIDGVRAPVQHQEACIAETADHFNLTRARTKDIIMRNIFMLIARDTIVEESPHGKPKLISKKQLAKSGVLSDLGCLTHPTRPLYEHQIRVTEALQTQRGLIVVHSVGSGKTLTAATAGHCFLENNPDMVVYVVTPVSLVENFREEIIRSFRGKNLDRYIFRTHAKFAKDLKNNRITQKMISKSMVIIDEIHNYRTKIPKGALKKQHNPYSRIPASFWVQQGIKPAQRVIGLTATPFVNEISDLTTIVSIVTGKDLFAKSKRKKSEFKLLIENSNKVFSFYEIEKGDPRFPTYTIHKIEIVMPADYYKKYMEIERFQARHVQQNFSEAFYGNIRVASNKIDNQTTSPKVMWTVNKVETIVRNGGRVVVFSNFINAGITIIQKNLAKKGIGCNFITGKINRKERNEIVKEYNSGKMPVLLISKAGGEGLDLKRTTAVIMLEPTWNSASRTQIFGRGIRNGSHLDLPESLRHVDCYILLMVKPKIIEGAYKSNLPSGDKFIYNITEDKHVASEAILSRLESLSIEGEALTRWAPHKQSYHIIPVEGGKIQEISGAYNPFEEEDLHVSDKTAQILEEIAEEEYAESEDEYFDLSAEEGGYTSRTEIFGDDDLAGDLGEEILEDLPQDLLSDSDFELSVYGSQGRDSHPEELLGEDDFLI